VQLTVDVDEEGDVERAEAVGRVTDVDARVGRVDGAYPQHSVVDTEPLPAEVDRLAVLGPRDEGRRRRRVDRADEAQVQPGTQYATPLVRLAHQPRRPLTHCTSKYKLDFTQPRTQHVRVTVRVSLYYTGRGDTPACTPAN